MSPLEILGLVIAILVGVPVALYTVARLIFTAYFITLDYYEKRKQHGPR